MATYPGGVKTFTTKTDNIDTVSASHVNDLQDEVNAIEDGLLNGSAQLSCSNATAKALSVTGGSTLQDATVNTLQVSSVSTFAGQVTFGSEMIWTVVQSTVSGQVNNWNPAGLSSATIIEVTADSTLSTITGITPRSGGRPLILTFRSTGITFAHDNAGSSADARLFVTLAGGNYLVASSIDSLWFYYSTQVSRWRRLTI
jgi:hypothetical protein